MGVRTFMRTLAEKLKSTLPLDNQLLEDLQFLSPRNQSGDKRSDAILRVARTAKQALPASEIVKLMMEFSVYQIDESITEDWYIEDQGKTNDGLPFIKWLSIDKYWAKVFKRTTDLGQPMYPTLSTLVKCVIIIAHGNADVERGFSANALIVTSDPSALNASSVSGLPTVHDAVRQSQSGRVTDVKITRPTLLAVQQAHSKYKADMELNAKAQQEVQSQQAANDAAHQERSLKRTYT